MSGIVEYRGVERLVYAEVTEDSADNYTTGTVKSLAGVATISKSTASSTEAHYYDNAPKIVISAEGADTVTLTVSVGPGGSPTTSSPPPAGNAVVVPESVRICRLLTSGPASGTGTVIRSRPRSTGSGSAISIHWPKSACPGRGIVRSAP